MFATHPLPLASTAADIAFHTASALQTVRGHAVPGEPIALLHLGIEQTCIAVVGEGTAPSPVVTLALGTRKTAREFFRHDIPTPLELENAIARVEDEVYLAHRQYAAQGNPSGMAWWSIDPHLVGLAELAGVPRGPAMLLTLEAMERLFQRLAAVSEGRPAASEGLPESVEFAATLLLLRELVHHMLFRQLHLVGQPSTV